MGGGPPRSTRLTHSFPTRRSSDLFSDVKVSDRSLVWNSDLVETFELQNLSARRWPRSSPPRTARNRAARTRARTSPSATTRSRSEEHTSELQSLMRNSYAVFCLNKKKRPS